MNIDNGWERLFALLGMRDFFAINSVVLLYIEESNKENPDKELIEVLTKFFNEINELNDDLPRKEKKEKLDSYFEKYKKKVEKKLKSCK